MSTRTKAPKQVAGYQKGVTIGDGSWFGRPRDYTRPALERAPAEVPADQRAGARAFAAYRARILPFLPSMPDWPDLTPIQWVAWCDAARASVEGDQ